MFVRGKFEEPFTIYTSLPRSPVPLSDGILRDANIDGGILIIESEKGADYITFFNKLVCLVSCF